MLLKPANRFVASLVISLTMYPDLRITLSDNQPLPDYYKVFVPNGL